MTSDSNWRDQALCPEIGPDLFDGWTDEHLDRALEQRLRSLCLDCPSSWDCLEASLLEEEGLPLEERQGYRAGTTPRERWLSALGVTADR